MQFVFDNENKIRGIKISNEYLQELSLTIKRILMNSTSNKLLENSLKSFFDIEFYLHDDILAFYPDTSWTLSEFLDLLSIDKSSVIPLFDMTKEYKDIILFGNRLNDLKLNNFKKHIFEYFHYEYQKDNDIKFKIILQKEENNQDNEQRYYLDKDEFINDIIENKSILKKLNQDNLIIAFENLIISNLMNDHEHIYQRMDKKLQDRYNLIYEMICKMQFLVSMIELLNSEKSKSQHDSLNEFMKFYVKANIDDVKKYQKDILDTLIGLDDPFFDGFIDFMKYYHYVLQRKDIIDLIKEFLVS